MIYENFPPCADCKHLDENPGGCPAFPQGVPDEILSGENKHTEKHPDQKGDLVFTPME